MPKLLKINIITVVIVGAVFFGVRVHYGKYVANSEFTGAASQNLLAQSVQHYSCYPGHCVPDDRGPSISPTCSDLPDASCGRTPAPPPPPSAPVQHYSCYPGHCVADDKGPSTSPTCSDLPDASCGRTPAPPPPVSASCSVHVIKQNVCTSDGSCATIYGTGSNQCNSETEITDCPQPPPTCGTFTASPNRFVIPPPGTATLTWSCSHASNCRISPGVGPVPPSGQTSVSVNQDTTYTLTCYGRGDKSSVSATANLTTRAFEYSGGKLKEIVPQ